MALQTVEWSQLEYLSQSLQTLSLGELSEQELSSLNQAVTLLEDHADWHGLIRLRDLFESFIVGESYANIPLFVRLAYASINAADHLGNNIKAGQYLHDLGHQLHRIGKHWEAIQVFQRSQDCYSRVEGYDFRALESYYMTALCYRAVHQRRKAKRVLTQVINELKVDDPWRAHPLQVLAWVLQDDGKLGETETLLEQVLDIHEKNEGIDAYILIQVLADLGEIKGFLRKNDEAEFCFDRALALAGSYAERGGRQKARTLVKKAQFYAATKRYNQAKELLRAADNELSSYSRYPDYVWRIDFGYAYVFLRQRKFRQAWGKLQAVFQIRRSLGLSNTRLVLIYTIRLLRHIGPPR
ncbi:MAG: hypothetical protein BroJett018_27570 [Chloroflexota bacterium]|nr:MAG: hypothetical protein BroJett018_27570 [Chloroflexota bacterium]